MLFGRRRGDAGRLAAAALAVASTVTAAPSAAPAEGPAVERAAFADESLLRASVRLVESAPPPPECMTSAELRTLVSSLLGRPTFVEAGGDLELRWLVVPSSSGGWEARLSLFGPTGELLGVRRVSAPETDCSGLDERLGLVVALLVDVPREDVVIALPPRPRPRPFATPWLAVGGEATVGRMPTVAPAVRAELGALLGGAVPGYLSFTLTPDLEYGTDVGTITMGSFALGLGMCPLWLGKRRVRGGGCAEAQVGRLAAAGVDLAESAEDSLTLGDLTALGRVDVPLARWLSLHGAVGASVPLGRPTVQAADAAGDALEAHTVSAVVGIARLSIALTIPPRSP